MADNNCSCDVTASGLLLHFYASVTVEKRIEPCTLIIRLSFTLFDTNSLLEFPIVYLHANIHDYINIIYLLL